MGLGLARNDVALVGRVKYLLTVDNYSRTVIVALTLPNIPL